MTLSTTFIVIWFSITLITSFIGQGTLGFFAYYFLLKQDSPPPPLELDLLKEEIIFLKQERELLKEEIEALKKDSKDFMSLILNKLLPK